MPSAGECVSVGAGGGRTCGLRTDGSVECWGKVIVPPTGKFTSVDSGTTACGVRNDGALECWGWKIEGKGLMVISAK